MSTKSKFGALIPAPSRPVATGSLPFARIPLDVLDRIVREFTDEEGEPEVIAALRCYMEADDIEWGIAAPASVPDELRQHILHMRSELTKQDRSPLAVRQKLAQRVTELLAAAPTPPAGPRESPCTQPASPSLSIEDMARIAFEEAMAFGVNYDAFLRLANSVAEAIAPTPPAQQSQLAGAFLLVTPEQVEKHATTAWECPPQSRVILVSSLERLHKKNTAAHDNLLDVVVGGVTEGERIEALARWLEQQHFRPDVMSIAAADLRALYSHAKDAEQAALRFAALEQAEQDAVKVPQFEQVAALMLSIGWVATGDAQWARLKNVLPFLRTLLEARHGE